MHSVRQCIAVILAVILVHSDGLLSSTAAAFCRRRDVVLWLLSLGADPDGDEVMHAACHDGTAEIVQLLVDVGGSVNGSSVGPGPLFSVMHYPERADDGDRSV